MSKNCLLFLLCCSFIATNSYAIDENPAITPAPDTIAKPISGTFNVVTNYLSEGLSNTNNAPAIQGGLTYTFAKSGIYFNAWGSNSDFISPQFLHSTVEFDAILGIANDVNDDWSYDIYFNQYIYPGTSDANYIDFIPTVTYKFFTLTTYFSGNVYGSHHTGIYVNGGINYPIPETFIHFSDISALASAGYYKLPIETGLNSYYNFMLGLQKKIKDFTLSLQWTDTARSNYPPFDGYHIVGTVLFEF